MHALWRGTSPDWNGVLHSVKSCHQQLPAMLECLLKLKCPSELVLTKCLLPGSFYPTKMFYFDLLLSMAMTLEATKINKYRATHFFWPYSHQMSSSYTMLQPCHIPRAYTWPCLLTFPEKTHKFSVRLKPDKWSIESLLRLPSPRSLNLWWHPFQYTTKFMHVT